EVEDGGVTLGVLVVARERLRAVCAQLAAIGRPPVAAHAELQCAPGGDAAWHLAIAGHGLVLRPGTAPAIALDPPLAAALPLLSHALDRARAANALPASIAVHAAPGVDGEMPSAAADLGCRFEGAAAYLWWQACPAATNLLQGQFAPSHKRAGWAGRLRGPMRLVAASGAILLLASVGEVLWQRQRLDDLELRMQRLFETALPNTPAIAPAAQLQRRLDEVRMHRGQLREDDLLALLAAYAQARGVATRDSVGALDYRDGHLTLALPALATAERDRLGARLAALGYDAEAGRSDAEMVIRAQVVR
ncbi:MAG: hypothetical protein KDF95_20505, partial [Rhodocyclaceae bacterium]|nr:hypothetical protein [Rhodocyclaceae bacterium]